MKVYKEHIQRDEFSSDQKKNSGWINGWEGFCDSFVKCVLNDDTHMAD